MGNPGALKRPQSLSPSRLGKAARLLAEGGVCPMDTRSLYGFPGSFLGAARWKHGFSAGQSKGAGFRVWDGLGNASDRKGRFLLGQGRPFRSPLLNAVPVSQ